MTLHTDPVRQPQTAPLGGRGSLTVEDRGAVQIVARESATMSTTSDDPIITSYAKAPARTITAGGVTYAYRELGPKGGIPVVFLVHLAATLDNWDPRIIDPIAKGHEVFAPVAVEFLNR